MLYNVAYCSNYSPVSYHQQQVQSVALSYYSSEYFLKIKQECSALLGAGMIPVDKGYQLNLKH